MSIFNSKKEDELVVANLNASECQLHHFSLKSDLPTQLAAEVLKYASPQVLYKGVADWSRRNNLKNKPCCWVLNHEIYKTHNIDVPEVADKEMLENLKLQAKELLDYDIDDVLMSYYRPSQDDSQPKKLVLVTVEKRLVESIIYLTKDAGLLLKSIEIEELAIGQALLSYLSDNKIVGYVGENKNGLNFNFYKGNELAFTRHKKGQFIPNIEEFSLDSEKQQVEETFLLETQRTIDYVISQLFRRPIDHLLLQPLRLDKTDDESSKQNYRSELAQTIQELVEVPVNLVSVSFNASQGSEDLTLPSLSDIGIALSNNR